MSETEKDFFKKERDMVGVYLSLPSNLAREITLLAHKYGVTVPEALMSFLSISSVANWALEDNDSEMVLCRKDGVESPLVFVPALAQEKYKKVEGGKYSTICMRIPRAADEELEFIANKNNLTTAQLVYSFIEFGLLVDRITEHSDYDLILREQGQEDEIMVLFEDEDIY